MRDSPLLWPGLVLSLAACGSNSDTKTVDAGVSARDASVDAGPAGLPLSIPPLDCSDESTDWPLYGQNACNTFSTRGEKTITAQTATHLGLKWSFDAAGDISATPAVVGGQVYVPDWGGMLNRIDAATGKAVWSKSVAELAGLGGDAGTWEGGAPDQIVSRGTPLVTDGMVIFGLRRGTFASPASLAYMVAVDQDTGALRWKTLLDPHVAAIITASPVLEAGRIYVGVSSMEEDLSGDPSYPCCSFRGSVVALDASSGQIVWQTYMIDDAA